MNKKDGCPPGKIKLDGKCTSLKVDVYLYTHGSISSDDSHDDWGTRMYFPEIMKKEGRHAFPTHQNITQEKGYAKAPFTITGKDLPDSIKNRDIKHTDICDILFSKMNNYDTNPLSIQVGGPRMQKWVNDKKAHTSLSVGDAISINNRIFVCEKIGWEEAKK